MLGQRLREIYPYQWYNIIHYISHPLYMFSHTDSPNISNQIKNWESCHYLSSNIFRKEERDWKMVYLARAEDAETATIVWKFDFTQENLTIKSVSIKFETKTYENGVIDLQILNDHGEYFEYEMISEHNLYSLSLKF